MELPRLFAGRRSVVALAAGTVLTLAAAVALLYAGPWHSTVDKAPAAAGSQEPSGDAPNPAVVASGSATPSATPSATSSAKPTVTPSPVSTKLPPDVTLARGYFVSATGSDTNPGTVSRPFRTIQRGADAAHAGDTVYVMAGVYNESGRPNPAFSGRGIVLSHSGTAGRRITFKPYPGHEGRVVVDQCATGPSTACPKNAASRVNAGFVLRSTTHYITIEGLEIRNAGVAAVWVASTPGESYMYGLVVRNNHIHDVWGNDNVGGIRPDVTQGMQIVGNTIHDVQTTSPAGWNASCVHIYLAGNARIEGNDLSRCFNGVRDKGPDPSGNLTTTRNTIHDVQRGFMIGGYTGNDVARHETFTGNTVRNAQMCVYGTTDLVPPTDQIRITGNTFDHCVTLTLKYFPHATIASNTVRGPMAMDVSPPPTG